MLHGVASNRRAIVIWSRVRHAATVRIVVLYNNKKQSNVNTVQMERIAAELTEWVLAHVVPVGMFGLFGTSPAGVAVLPVA